MQDGYALLGAFVTVGMLVLGWLTLTAPASAGLSQECGVTEQPSPNRDVYHEAEFTFR